MRRKKGTGCAVVIIVFFLLVAITAAGVLFLLENENIHIAVGEISGEKSMPYPKAVSKDKDSSGSVVLQKYYYEKLSGEDRRVYQEILQGIMENEAEIDVHTSEAEQANQIFQYVLRDSPEIFWCEGSVTATAYGGMDPHTVLEPEYGYDESDKEKMQEEIDAAAAEWLSGISMDASDYDKILYVYERIVNSVEYDTQAEDNQTIYSVFVRKRSVCAGYARAMQYLLEKLGVFCTYVTGTVEGQSHAWNLVLCGGDYYYVDVTWGDPVFQTETEEKADFDYISYDYMCCSEEELMRTHKPEKETELPACTKMDSNYYVVNGMYYTSYDSQEALQAMNDVIASGSNPVVLKYSDETVYKEAKKDIFEDIIHRAAQNLAKQYDLMEVKYKYIDDEKLNKIVIYWEYS